MSIEEEIQQIVSEYNEAEQRQTERFRKLFYLLKARKGYRHIRFIGGDILNNCWDLEEERLDKVYFLNNYNRGIEEVEAGQP